MATEAREGVVSFLYTGGQLTVTQIETWDLLGEGIIEGLVTGSYVYQANPYQVGYTSANFTPYPVPPNTTNGQYLRSIYFNNVPVVNSNNKFNFQNVNTNFTPGLPDGEVLTSTDDSNLTISRAIGERLYGSRVDANGNPTDTENDNIKYYRIYNTQCRAVIVNVKFNTLVSQVTQGSKTGDIEETEVSYRIYYRPVFSTINSILTESNSVTQITSDSSVQFILGENVTVKGKITQGYIESSRIDFNANYITQKNFAGWEIKLVRITPDSLTSNLRNATYVDSLTEVYANIYSYPHSAIVYCKFNADSFAQIPNRAFMVKGLKVKVPNNYNPITKTYSNISESQEWAGEFSEELQWTDNPAWCFYDLLTNKRYGLGEYIAEEDVDIYTLYEISKYCDTMVPDGYGGYEPRFSCNLTINSREDAYKVINDFGSIFRALIYFANGTVYSVQDAEKDPITFFTNANVLGGAFQYSSSSIRDRHSIALVRYNDKDNFYKTTLEYVEDFDALRKIGPVQTDVTAFGCTSKGQAVRFGRWILASENLETESVSFTAGPEANYLKPGDVIGIYDQFRKANRLCGRTYNVEEWINPSSEVCHKVTLDSRININTGDIYALYLNTPTFFYNPTQVDDLGSNDYINIRRPQYQYIEFTGIAATGTGYAGRTEIKLPVRLDTSEHNIVPNATWIVSYTTGSGINTYDLHSNNLDPSYDYYRIIKNTRVKNNYEISAVTYNADKFLKIESGLAFERPTNVYGVSPTSPNETLHLYLLEGGNNNAEIGYSFVMNNYVGVNSYRVFVKKGNFTSETEIPSEEYLAANLPFNQTDGVYTPDENNDYFFRVYAVNDAFNIYSNSYASGVITVYNSDAIQNVYLSQLNFSTDVLDADPAARSLQTGYYTSSSPEFGWVYGYLENNVNNKWKYRISIREPSSSFLPSSNIYYQNTGYVPQDRGTPTFTFDLETNINEAGGIREYDIVVEAIDENGYTSAGNIQNLSAAPYFTENWNNGNGYDIFYVNNSGINNVRLGLQSIYPNTTSFGPFGTVNIKFDNGVVLPTDLVGAYIYASTGNFSGQNITGVPHITAVNTINTGYITFSNTDTQITYPQLIKNLLYNGETPKTLENNSGYLAISLFDSFDLAKKENGVNIQRTLSVSNVSGHKLFFGTSYSSASPTG